jgi:nucleotide-binding universal stress UspA family protein
MTVLLAYIRTPDGDAALAAAVDEARRRATKAVVVNVTRPVAEVDSPMSAEQALDAVAALFEGAGVDVEVRQLPASPDRAGAILAVMSEIQPDLVVIGMHKRNPVGELIIGSTSQRIIRGAECPVLVVKAPTS